MNIAMNQLMAKAKVSTTNPAQQRSSTKVAEASQTASSKVEGKETSKFGSVFNQVMTVSNKLASSTQSTTTSNGEVDLNQLEQVLDTQSMEELFDLLGISHDDGLLMIQVGEEGQAVAIDEMLNLEDLTAVLNIDPAQLLQTMNELLGEEKEASDLWDLLTLVGENAPLLLSQITASLQGNETVKVTPKESKQLLEFLKVAELVGKQSDLTFSQETNLTNTKQLLSQVLTQLQKQTETTTGKISLPGFQQVVQQTMTTKQQDTSANEVVSAANSTVVKSEPITVTITLPTSKPAQSEAFLKEMQNLLSKAQMSNNAGLMKLSIKLYPENLGSIRVELVQQNGVMTARLLASTSMGRELLDNNAHQLKQAFIQQNIQVDRLDIAQSLQETDKNRDQGFFNNFFNQQQEQENDKKTNDDDDDEKLSFSEFLINEEV